MTRIPRAYLAAIGSRRSDAKTAAARANGAKGGRPRIECVTGVTPPDHQHRVGQCPACRRAARLRREGRYE